MWIISVRVDLAGALKLFVKKSHVPQRRENRSSTETFDAVWDTYLTFILLVCFIVKRLFQIAKIIHKYQMNIETFKH